MTKEERALRKKEDQEYRSREWERFPPAWVWRSDEHHGSLVNLGIRGGDSSLTLTVEKSPEVKWKTYVLDKSTAEREYCDIHLTLSELVELIRALAARYHHVAEHINQAVAAIALPPPLARIEEKAPPPPLCDAPKTK